MVSETAGTRTAASRVGLVALLSAHIVSMLGSVVTTVAVPWLVLTTTGSATKMGLISAATVFPALLAGVFATPLADRFGIRRTMIVAESCAALAMAAVAATPQIGFLPLAALVAVKGALNGVGGRAQHVMLRPVSDAAGMQIIRTTAIYDGTGNLAMVTGAPVGALLIFWLSPQGAIWFDAASFALSALLVATLVHPPAGTMPDREKAANESYLAALRGGAAHLWRDRLLMGMLVMTSVINLFTVANYAVFVPLWVDEKFGAAPAVGLILSAFACGAIVGNIAFTVFGPKLPQYLTFSISLVLCVAPRQLTLGLTDNLVVVLAVSVLCGVTQAAIRPILGAMLYSRVPVDLQNRVFGMVNAVTGSCVVFGATLAGLAVVALGLQPAIHLSGSLCLVITLVPLLRYRTAAEHSSSDGSTGTQDPDGGRPDGDDLPGDVEQLARQEGDGATTVDDAAATQQPSRFGRS
jgi:MFS family permease